LSCGAYLTPEVKFNVELLPINERILVKIVSNEHATKGGLFLPSGESHFAEIIATGAGRITEDGEQLPMAVKPGDKVMLAGSRVGVEVMLEGVAHRVITERDILGLVR
jgi:chaperonin GroES